MIAERHLEVVLAEKCRRLLPPPAGRTGAPSAVRAPYACLGGNMCHMKLRVEVEREADGRWIAEVPELAGTMAYGATRNEAVAGVEALALRVLADRLEHGETAPSPLEVAFIAA